MGITPSLDCGLTRKLLNQINKLTDMKRKILFLVLFLTFLAGNVFSQTVYITKTGAKYHTEGCRYLSQSKIAIDLADAIAKGYGACSVCKPSSKVSSSTTPNTKVTKTEVKSSTNQSAKTVTQSASVQCSATTKAGTRCKRTTKSSNGKCWQHGGN
jgi:hypothetical protein